MPKLKTLQDIRNPQYTFYAIFTQHKKGSYFLFANFWRKEEGGGGGCSVTVGEQGDGVVYWVLKQGIVVSTDIQLSNKT